jgi:hypothetical protein
MTPAQGTSTEGKVSPLFEIARLLVRLDHVAGFVIKRESPHRLIGCSASRSRLRC